MAFDVNKLFKDPLKNLAAIRYAFQKTDIGRSGLIRIELDENQKIAYTLATTGEKFSDYETAFAKASSLMITKYNIITPLARGEKGKISIPLDSAYNPKTEQAAEFLRVINSNEARSKLASHREQLQKLGMSAEEVEEIISGTRQISMQLSQVKDQADVKNYVVDFIKRQLKKLDPTRENLFPFIDKDGGNILKFTSFSTTGKISTFNNAQIHYMLNAMGLPMLGETADLFGAKSMEDFLQKLPKRFKGMFSERDMTIVSQDVASALGEGKTLDNSVLIIEEGLDFLRKAMGVKARSKDVSEAIISTDAGQVLRSSLTRQITEQEGTSLTKSQISLKVNELTESLFGTTGSLRSILETSQTNKDFLAAVQASLGEENPQFKMVKQLFEDAEKELDGDAVINKKVFDATKKRLRSQLKDARARIRAGETDEALMESINNMQRQLDLLDRSDLYQITGRGFLEEGQPKFAAQVRSFSKRLSNKYAMVIGRSGMKKELGLGGTGEATVREIILSGFGQAKGIVYSDPNLIATHPEIFASEEALKAMQQNSSKVLKEMNDAIAQDMLSPKLIKNLKKQLETDFDGLPEPVRQAKERNKRFAQEIVQLHEMGIGPKNSPAMMNLLAKFFQTEMFTMEEGKYGTLFHPVLPNTQRFALATEASHGLASNFKSILGKGEVQTTFSKMGLSEADEVFSQNLMTFRVHSFEGAGPRLLFGAGKVPEFFNALGGFDLDDKGLPTIIKYKDETNAERILFSLTRQPTSFQENIYARARLDDAETLKHLFGDRDEFMKTLSAMVDEGASGAQTLKALITGEVPSTVLYPGGMKDYLEAVNTSESLIEQTILATYKKMGRSITTVYEDNGRILKQIEKFGSTALTSKEFQRSGLELVEEFKKANNAVFEEAFPQIKDDLIKSVESFKSILDEDTFNKLNSAIESNDSKAVSNILSKKGVEDNIALRSIREMTLMSRLQRGSESADILGSYVNRSMVIGSTLNQFDDFMQAFITNSAEKDFLYGDGIKLISSELAIDKSTGFSLFKGFSELVRQQISESDPDSALRVLNKIIGRNNMTVQQIGEEAIVELGSRVGKMAGLQQTAVTNMEARIGKKLTKEESENLFPIIDRLFLTSKRLSENDQYLFAEGILKGLTQAEEKYGRDLMTEKAKEIKDLLESSISRKSREDTLKIINEQFASSTSVYAKSSAVQNQMAEIHGIQQQMLRMNLSIIRSNQIVAGTQTTEEAMTAARLIIERNKEALEASIILKEGSNTETVDQILRQIGVGEKILSDFEESMKLMSGQTTRQNLFDALEKQAQRMGVRFTTDDVIRVMHPLKELADFSSEMISAKTNRIAKFYGDISENQIASKILSKLNQAKEVASYAGAKLEDEKLLKALLERSIETTSDFNDVEQATIRAILGEDDPFKDLTADQVARAKEARGIYGASEMQEKISQETQDKLGAIGQATPEGQAESKFSKILRNMLAGEEYSEAADKASYKRISKFIKEDLSTLFSENKVFRNSIYGIGALIAGSLIYSSVQDRSPESVGGPTLLPGGSAYEAYPSRSPQVPSTNSYSYTPGMSYKVNLYGNRSNIEDFTQLFGGFGGNIDIDTTMYSGIPQVGRDPYQDIASSY